MRGATGRGERARAPPRAQLAAAGLHPPNAALPCTPTRTGTPACSNIPSRKHASPHQRTPAPPARCHARASAHHARARGRTRPPPRSTRSSPLRCPLIRRPSHTESTHHQTRGISAPRNRCHDKVKPWKLCKLLGSLCRQLLPPGSSYPHRPLHISTSTRSGKLDLGGELCLCCLLQLSVFSISFDFISKYRDI